MCETKLVCAYANSSKHFCFFCIRLVRGRNLEWDMEPVYKYHFNLDPKAISTVWLIQQMFPKSCILSAGMWIQAAPERVWNSGCIYICMYVCIYNSWIIAVILASTHHMGKYVYPPAITCGPGKSLTYNTIKKNIRPFLYYTWFMYIYICIYTNKSAFAWQASSQRVSTLYIPFLAEIGIWSTEQTFEGEKMQLRASTGVLAALWNPIGGWIPL